MIVSKAESNIPSSYIPKKHFLSLYRQILKPGIDKEMAAGWGIPSIRSL
jgi:hypothetical protein